MSDFQNFDTMIIKIASPEKIRSWSHGEVKKPETINYRTLKPEKDGLFCEKIFGPTKDYECSCGKYKRIRYKGVVCEKCGVEVTKSKVRRERMGHIELATPVSHIWYFKGIPSKMGLLLDMSPRVLEKILYFASYVVIDPGDTDLYYKQELSEDEYQEAIEKYGYSFEAQMGAEAIKKLLEQIDLEKEYQSLLKELEETKGQKKVRISRRLDVINSFIQSDNKPEWIILDVIPVMPPDLRPMVQLEGGRFATSDLNDLYRRVINRNNRLKRLLDIGAPDIIVRNEKRMLQEAVDALIDNGRMGRAVTGASNRNMKSLSDLLKGKNGRFRQNLLGKRVDYSGRSVIVVGPELKFNQCGLPQEMAIELFKPFIMNEVVKRGYAHNLKNAKKMIERKDDRVYEVLEEVIKDHPVMLNRAPTLHRLGIQAFEPVLVDGKAIKLHPLACTAFNADFDGDQMAIHVPLSNEAQAEARLLMLSTNNILSLKDGKPITTPTQDMVLGSYYMTTVKEDSKGEGSIFKDFDEMIMAFLNHYVEIQSKVGVMVKPEGKPGKIVKSTVGRFIFNSGIPQDLGFVDRSEDPYSLEVDFQMDSGKLNELIDRCYRKHGNIITAELLDYIKSTGYKYSTLSGLSFGLDDVVVPHDKWEILARADEKVDEFEKIYRRGFITDEERYEKVIEVWKEVTDEVTEALMKDLKPTNSIKIFADSGARGSTNQIRQLGGMRGLMSRADGRTIEIPIKANFREGLSVQEYFISSHGSRKGLTDTALRTADSGYLTRRMVDVSQDVIVTEDDCHTDGFILAKEFREGNEIVESLHDRILGKTSFEDVKDPQTSEIIVHKNELIDETIANKITSCGIKEVKIRSVLECKSRHGVCAKCYGVNLANGKTVNIGEAVGIIAAQSIGEPGTQLTMRTFHSGGIAGVGITQGLPRVEELFEARKPKGRAYISENSGEVALVQNDKKIDVEVTSDDGTVKKYNIPYGSRFIVQDGDYIEKGAQLTEGSVDPHDILEVSGKEAVQDYITKEVQKVYRIQGVDIDDKHVQVIIKQMLKKVKILDKGNSKFLPGSLVERLEVENENEKLVSEGKKPATYEQQLLGITKASLATDSWLSAASFQETTRVLTDSSVKGDEDNLKGLKENIIIGKLIPAGTGMKQYRKIDIDYPDKELEDEQIRLNREALEEQRQKEQEQNII
ncbi:MAG: DNA-directed RNA polymerase subunit beta' [Peptoniphilaceae bacterium]|nr:DNA-directed RNA polymerase subunit beta' [Peptoniphilaceae bacterium]MDY3737622.1 DNA-directed RNA polymerase subunit beta' [Peptoniphilaceae bacterium]